MVLFERYRQLLGRGIVLEANLILLKTEAIAETLLDRLDGEQLARSTPVLAKPGLAGPAGYMVARRLSS